MVPNTPVNRVTYQSLPYIYVVEDDPRDLELTTEALGCSHIHVTVTVARDGVEAVKLADYDSHRFRCPSLMLLDLKLPRLNGFEVLKKVRETGSRMPVVVFSGSTSERDVERTYALGGNAFVTKPVAYGDYRRVIDNIAAFWLKRNFPPPSDVADPRAVAQ